MPGKTVLIADDDAVIVAMLATALRQVGLQVLVARDAMQTVMAAHRSRPDAILLDIQMPGGTGLDALKKIRSSTQTQVIPTIVISGSSDPTMADQVRALGVGTFLTKPIDPAEVQRQVLAVLDLPATGTA